jgi:hypothetical protein
VWCVMVWCVIEGVWIVFKNVCKRVIPLTHISITSHTYTVIHNVHSHTHTHARTFLSTNLLSLWSTCTVLSGSSFSSGAFLLVKGLKIVEPVCVERTE